MQVYLYLYLYCIVGQTAAQCMGGRNSQCQPLLDHILPLWMGWMPHQHVFALDLPDRFLVIPQSIEFQTVTKSILMLEAKLLLKMKDFNRKAH